jgi:hypothetical protein
VVMNPSGNRSDIRTPQRRLVQDVQARSARPSIMATNEPLSAAPVQAAFKPVVPVHESFADHLKRMVATAGHSWTTTEHDVFFTPAQTFGHKINKTLGDKIPARLRNSKYAPGQSQFWSTAYFGLLVLALAAIPTTVMIQNSLRAQRYELSSAAQKLVGKPVGMLDKQLSYDAKTNSYRYNPNAANGVQAVTDGGDNGTHIGGSQYYGLELPTDPAKGQTFTDAQTKLSFTLTPQFSLLSGKHVDGHMVYPTDGGQVVYTIKSDGLKEDVVLTKPIDSKTLSYKLDLPNTLEARLNPDGSVGVYSASPALFGNVSISNDKDQALIDKARQNSTKDTPIFTIPAPVITEAGAAKGTGKAKFSLNNNVLTVSASNLQDLSYPISIDPSVVVNNANSFSFGNDEDDALTVSSSSLTRAGISGGDLSTSWSTATGSSALSVGTSYPGTAVYNGYVYVTGGATTTNVGTLTWYAQIGTNGALGAWQPGTALLHNIEHHQSVAYNGWLYVLGGNYNGTNTGAVQAIQIASNGSINGSWTSTGMPSMTGTRVNFSAMTYNGYLYVISGCTSNNTGSQCSTTGQDNTYQEAKINYDGTLGSWSTPVTAGFSARDMASATVYNGYMYLGGGCLTRSGGFLNCTATGTDVWYAKINGDGTLGVWKATSSFTTFRSAFVLSARNGYMYIAGGCIGQTVGTVQNCNSNSGTTEVQYAPIYANGTLGSWTTVNAGSTLPTERYGASGFMANNAFYLIGGCTNNTLNCNGSAYNTDVISAKISAFSAAAAPTGSPTSWSAGNAVIPTGGGTNGLFGAASVDYNGYIYTLGGCTSTASCTSGGTPTTNLSTQYAAVCTGGNTTTAFTSDCTTTSTPGTTTEWLATSSMTSRRYGFGAFAYNGRMYAVGGCTTGTTTTCSSTQNTVESAPINSDGSLGTWVPNGTFAASGLWGIGVASYNGNAYITGGANSSGTLTGNVLYTQIGAISSSTTAWTTSGTALSPALFGTAAVAYGGYLYVAGGETVSPGSNAGLTSTVQYAPISASTGAPGSWSTSTSYGTALTGVSMLASNGVLYIVGGASSTPTYQSNVLSAPIQSSGALGMSPGNTWASSGFTGARRNASAATSNGYIFVMGGYNASITDTMQTGSLQTIARVAHYSRLLDLTSTVNNTPSNPLVTRYLLTGTSGGSGSACLSLGTAVTFGTLVCGNTTPLGIFGEVNNTTARYVLVATTIDDSQQAFFDDSNASTVTGMNIMFRAANNRRLRMGQTFTNNNSETSNQLDTEGP